MAEVDLYVKAPGRARTQSRRRHQRRVLRQLLLHRRSRRRQLQLLHGRDRPTGNTQAAPATPDASTLARHHGARLVATHRRCRLDLVDGLLHRVRQRGRLGPRAGRPLRKGARTSSATAKSPQTPAPPPPAASPTPPQQATAATASTRSQPTRRQQRDRARRRRTHDRARTRPRPARSECARRCPAPRSITAPTRRAITGRLRARVGRPVRQDPRTIQLQQSGRRHQPRRLRELQLHRRRR